MNADFHLNISASTVIGWSAAEVGWTTPANGNYFNEQTGTNWIDQTPCPAGGSGTWACFSSFESSATSAFFSSIVMQGYQAANGLTYNRPSPGFILADQLNSRGASLATAFQQVASGGNSGGFNRNDKNYGTNVANTISSTTTHVQCMQQNGYVH